MRRKPSLKSQGLYKGKVRPVPLQRDFREIALRKAWARYMAIEAERLAEEEEGLEGEENTPLHPPQGGNEPIPNPSQEGNDVDGAPALPGEEENNDNREAGN